MNDRFNRNRNLTQPLRSRWALSLILGVILIAVGAAAFFGNNHPPPVQLKADSPPPEDALSALQQKVKGAVDQIGDMQRELSAEQGERKLLSEQIGALAARVDSLERARTENTTPTKKRGSPR
jgi:hypothetical protein